MKTALTATALITVFAYTFAYAGAVEDLLTSYRTSGAQQFNAERGQAVWTKTYSDKKTGEPRNCELCHTNNLKGVGEHRKTGEPIEPLAPSVNPKRFTDIKFIEKWFKRNCKWTIGRECTNQEKGDLLVFLRKQ
ncbi:MAG: DUF1924 domain-containing protein [Nitrospinota bacterium]